MVTVEGRYDTLYYMDSDSAENDGCICNGRNDYSTDRKKTYVYGVEGGATYMFTSSLGIYASASYDITFLVLLPAMLLRPAGRGNNLIIIWKIFISVQMVSIFNHTTQWNHITSALRRLHVPGVFIFTIDISLKYIVLLGRLINDLLTSYLLRAVGKNKQKYTSVGGVMGVVFLRGTEMNRQMYEAMVCRGFTDDYEGL